MQITAAPAADMIIKLTVSQHAGRVVATSSQLPDFQNYRASLIGLDLASAVAWLHSAGPHPRQAWGAALHAAAQAANTSAAHDTAAASLIERRLAAEAADVHLYQLMLLWPQALGVDAHRTQYAELHRRLRNEHHAAESFDLGGELLDLLSREMLGGFYNNIRFPRSLSEFIERADRGSVLGEVLRKLIELGPSQPQLGKPTPILGELSAAAWANALGDWPSAPSVAHPLFYGEPAETGPLARHAASPMVHLLLQRGHRLSARLFAKVSDLADCASRMRYPLSSEVPPLLDAATTSADTGLARVNAASGVLLCWVRMNADKIADCAFVPPAAWNFHPQGAFNNEACASTVETADAARLRLSLLALALEPGLFSEIEIDTVSAAPAAATAPKAAAAKQPPASSAKTAHRRDQGAKRR